MMTRKLWRALNDPPATHPLFRRVVVLPTERYKRRYASWAGVIITLVIGLSEHVPTLLFFLMPLLLFITGVVYGIDCALRVSHAIAREHENDTFHLLALSPPGALGISWAVCTSSLYRNHEFHQLQNIVKSSLIIASIVTAVVGSLVLLGQSAMFTRLVEPPSPTVVNIVTVCGLIILIYTEYAQSAILGCLVGMLMPTYTKSSLDAGFYAFGAFLLVEVSSYFVAVLVGFSIVPILYQLIGVSGTWADMSLSVIRVAAFIAVREGIIQLLWHHLIQRLNAGPTEFDFVMPPAVM